MIIRDRYTLPINLFCLSRNLHRDEKRDTITTAVDHGIFRNRIQKITYTSWL